MNGSTLVTALGRATADGRTLFGHAIALPSSLSSRLDLVTGRPHEIDERVLTRYLDLPQVRRSQTVLGCSVGGWGYRSGVNERGVAVGRAPLHTRLAGEQHGLLGDELVRLVLERAHSAQHALDLLMDFVRHNGHGSFVGSPDDVEDSVFLIADGREAFAVEAGGPHYVWQQVRELRVLGPLGTVRSDWDGISPGLSDHVIGQGWWPGDGSKIDFAGCACPPLAEHRAAARRWGRTTLDLTQQTGHVDVPFLRRLLTRGDDDALRTPCLVTALAADAGRPPTAWVAVGPTRFGVFFPLPVSGELPEAFAVAAESNGAIAPPHADFASAPVGVAAKLFRLEDAVGENEAAADRAREALDRLQARLDQDADEFAGDDGRQATLFVQHCVERFDEVIDGLTGRPARRAARVVSAGEESYVFEG